MNSFKRLASDTVLYGMSSIVGRFLNWWLMPLYVSLFAPAEYGVVTNLYSYVAFFMVFLTYGMETGYFRFASKSSEPEKVYSTSLISLFFTSSLFLFLVVVFKQSLANLIQYSNHPEYIFWLAIILAIDAFTAIPFARLRLNNRPLKFAMIKLINIGFNIGFNLFFLLLCPKILSSNPHSIVHFVYSADIGVGYVFISNLLASLVTLLLLLPEIFRIHLKFDRKLLINMLSYSFPILIVGLAGMVNQNIDKILLPFLIPETENPMQQLGIYGAGVKIAVLMNMFIQAFRYAFEPFFFSQAKVSDDKTMHATIMKYFVIFGLLIFLGMMLYIDVIKLIIPVEYEQGFTVVPLILMANLFFGIYFTLSLWYKLTDKTRYGAYMALIGAAITLVLNIILIPKIGYMGSAIAVFSCFFVMMIISYVLGQKFYPVPYDLKRIAIYFALALVLYFFSFYTEALSLTLKYALHTVFMGVFLFSIFSFEKRELKKLFVRKKLN
ncbi:lipopolysaccharide biosynthesis protein [Maribellus sediminis]|uniref:lipopolysaccharide biosynthesis protein n=1 Tax=Maribellus sediminis TaxID=2696285 RepID=UPI001430EDED|nr:polysaccharide biosynthesis C-terminal domain-containing protein [Maribellus sediminis]